MLYLLTSRKYLHELINRESTICLIISAAVHSYINPVLCTINHTVARTLKQQQHEVSGKSLNCLYVYINDILFVFRSALFSL